MSVKTSAAKASNDVNEPLDDDKSEIAKEYEQLNSKCDSILKKIKKRKGKKNGKQI